MNRYRHAISKSEMKWDYLRSALKEFNKVNAPKTFGQEVTSRQLTPGMMIAAYSDGCVDFGIFKGFTGDDEKYGEGGVEFKTAKDLLNAYDCSSYGMLEEKQDKNEEYGQHSYMVFEEMEEGENKGTDQPWYYLFKGRWSRGSGATPVSFIELISEEEDAVRTEAKVEADRLANEKRTRNSIRRQVAHYASEIIRLANEHPDLDLPYNLAELVNVKEEK